MDGDSDGESKISFEFVTKLFGVVGGTVNLFLNGESSFRKSNLISPDFRDSNISSLTLSTSAGIKTSCSVSSFKLPRGTSESTTWSYMTSYKSLNFFEAISISYSMLNVPKGDIVTFNMRMLSMDSTNDTEFDWSAESIAPVCANIKAEGFSVFWAIWG